MNNTCVPAQDQQDKMTAKSVLAELLQDRFSCRAFLNKPVPKATISQILSLAQRTPSWCNTQPWQLVITSGEGTEKFRTALLGHLASTPAPAPDIPFPREYKGIHLDRRRESGFQLYDALGIAKGDRKAYTRQTRENFRFFGAPHVAIITTPEELGAYGAVDCGAYVGIFTLAAQAVGVSTIPQAALSSFSPFIREYFAIPSGRQMVCGISFGYADPDHPANSFRTSRAEADMIVDWVE